MGTVRLKPYGGAKGVNLLCDPCAVHGSKAVHFGTVCREQESDSHLSYNIPNCETSHLLLFQSSGRSHLQEYCTRDKIKPHKRVHKKVSAVVPAIYLNLCTLAHPLVAISSFTPPKYVYSPAHRGRGGAYSPRWESCGVLIGR